MSRIAVVRGILGLDSVESLRNWGDAADRDRSEIIVGAIFMRELRHDVAVALAVLSCTLLLPFDGIVTSSLEESAWTHCKVVYSCFELRGKIKKTEAVRALALVITTELLCYTYAGVGLLSSVSARSVDTKRLWVSLTRLGGVMLLVIWVLPLRQAEDRTPNDNKMVGLRSGRC